MDSNDRKNLLDEYGVTEGDLEIIRAAGQHFLPRLEDMLDRFYEWMRARPAFAEFFAEEATVERARSRQVEFWKSFFEADISTEFVDSRRKIGSTHVQIGLPLSTYFSGVTAFNAIVSEMLGEFSLPEGEQIRFKQAIDRLVSLDTSLVVETYYEEVTATIREQGQALMEMSTPVTEIWNGVLLLPLVGLIDSKRALDVMTTTLEKIAQTRARVFILDISGVGVVDTAVANHLVRITKATRLMGCESTISGVSASIARTIVELGIDVGSMKTTATMRDALAGAFREIGVHEIGG